MRRHLNQDKIVLLGHSWGSILGVHMAREHPELFSAYVGTGQFTDLKRAMSFSYPALLKRAQENNWVETMRGLEILGPPPYDTAEKYFVLVGMANVLDPPVTIRNESLALSALKNAAAELGSASSYQMQMLPELFHEDLPADASSFQIPVLFISGSEDLVTPNAKSYFDGISAPRKYYVELAGLGHLAIFRAPDKMLENLLRHVR